MPSRSQARSRARSRSRSRARSRSRSRARSRSRNGGSKNQGRAAGATPTEAPTMESEHEKAYEAANPGIWEESAVNEEQDPAEKMKIAFKDIIQKSPSADILIKAWADILQKELKGQALLFNVEKVSFIATIAEVPDGKVRKNKRQVKLQCRKDDPHNSSNNWSIKFE